MTLLERMQAFALVDDNERNAELLANVYAAAEYLTNAGVQLDMAKLNEDRDTAPLYDGLAELAVFSLALHWFDNKDAISEGNVNETPLGLRQIITQLKLQPREGE